MIKYYKFTVIYLLLYVYTLSNTKRNPLLLCLLHVCKATPRLICIITKSANSIDNADCIRKFEPNFYGSQSMTLLKNTLNHVVGRNSYYIYSKINWCQSWREFKSMLSWENQYKITELLRQFWYKVLFISVRESLLIALDILTIKTQFFPCVNETWVIYKHILYVSPSFSKMSTYSW